jgi:hypothetical protein
VDPVAVDYRYRLIGGNRLDVIVQVGAIGGVAVHQGPGTIGLLYEQRMTARNSGVSGRSGQVDRLLTRPDGAVTANGDTVLNYRKGPLDRRSRKFDVVDFHLVEIVPVARHDQLPVQGRWG